MREFERALQDMEYQVGFFFYTTDNPRPQVTLLIDNLAVIILRAVYLEYRVYLIVTLNQFY